MKIVAMLNFYDETPDDLSACIESISFVDALIALDGPYAGYPHGDKIRSDPDALEAIMDTCGKHDIRWSISQPGVPWEGNEVEKRNEMLRLALSPREWMIGAEAHGKKLFDEAPPLAGPEDWLLVVDTDHRWEIDSEQALRFQLQTTNFDFAEVYFGDTRFLDGRWAYYELRLLMRAIPGMRYERNHYTTVLPDGRFSNLRRKGSTASALDITDMAHVHHLVHDRDPVRRAKQVVWYDDRDGNKREIK